MGSKQALEIAEKYFVNTPFRVWLRKALWHHSVIRRLGMFHYDTYDEHFVVIDEALRRMPQDLWNARMERISRATHVALKNEWLPKDQWVKWEEEDWYLAPYIHEVEQELKDYQRYRGKKPWFFQRIFFEKMH